MIIILNTFVDQVIMRTERPCPDLVDGKAGPALPIEEWKAWTISQVTLQDCCSFGISV